VIITIRILFQKSPKSTPISSKMLVYRYLVDSNLVLFSLQYYFPPAESFHEFFVIKNCRFVVCCSLYDQLSNLKFYFKVFIIDCDNNKEQVSKISKIITYLFQNASGSLSCRLQPSPVFFATLFSFRGAPPPDRTAPPTLPPPPA